MIESFLDKCLRHTNYGISVGHVVSIAFFRFIVIPFSTSSIHYCATLLCPFFIIGTFSYPRSAGYTHKKHTGPKFSKLPTYLFDVIISNYPHRKSKSVALM